jgi:glycosyltransferase involved in cell wall biosynthesis
MYHAIKLSIFRERGLMKKILYVIGSLNVGGAEMHLFQLLPKLKEKNWEVEVFCLNEPGVLSAQLKDLGIKVSSAPYAHKPGSSSLYRAFRISIAFCSLFVFLLFRRFKIVHFFLPTAYLMGAICSIATGTKFKIMSRRSLNLYQRSHPFLFKVEKKLHSFMSGILGNSQAVIAQLTEEGVSSSKLHLIYNGVDISRFNHTKSRKIVRETLAIPDANLVFAIVANLIPYKGHSVLLHALSIASSQINKPWALLIIGRDDGIGDNLKLQAEQYNLSNIHWLGSRADIPDVLQSADIGILSSLEEGFSNAILECMASGLPMVVTDVGGNKEAVVDGVTGFVVPPNDPNALAQALVKLANNEYLRKQYSRASLERISTEFTIEACVNKYDLFYKNLIVN